MHHYYTNDESKHDIKTISYDYEGQTFTFQTDAGVFSKDRIDYGSNVLIKGVISHYEGSAKTMVDMGAGYGPIAIVLSRFLAVTPTFVDVNIRALVLAEKNATSNEISGSFYERNQYEETHLTTDLYVTNPPFRAGKQVILEIIEDGYNRLNDSGMFYMVVQKKQGMPSYKRKIEEVFGNVVVVLKDKGYYVLHAQK